MNPNYTYGSQKKRWVEVLKTATRIWKSTVMWGWIGSKSLDFPRGKRTIFFNGEDVSSREVENKIRYTIWKPHLKIE